MTLYGKNRKWLIPSHSYDALLALSGRVKPGVPAAVTQGAKAGSEILSPQATAGDNKGQQSPPGPLGGAQLNQLPSSPRADS